MEELGAYVDQTVSTLKRYGWHTAINTLRGRSNLHPDVKKLPHPAAPLLDRMRRNGVPVVIQTAPWTAEMRQARLNRGPHKSALEYSEFLAAEFLDFCRKGYWMLLPYELVKDRPELRLSPIGVVPQRERRPRVIVDYSYYGVNDETLKLAPQESMQFGKALSRMLQGITEADRRYGDCYIYKVDVADGFYRVWLCTSSVAKLGVVLPKMEGLPNLVAFPLVLPMGWTESPPYFSVTTETVCDLTNNDLRRNLRYPAHALEPVSATRDDEMIQTRGTQQNYALKHETRVQDLQLVALRDNQPTLPKRRKYRKRPLAQMDVFVDDFCGTAQDDPQNPATNQRRTLFHNLDRVFRKNDAEDPPTRKEPNAINKLKKGDASINTIKRALGWDLDGFNRMLKVPSHRTERALTTLSTLAQQTRVGRKTWESMLGDLRNLTPGIPGGRGQFSMLQAALVEAKDRIRITDSVKAQLEDLYCLVKGLDDRATHMEELVPEVDPRFIGASDAAKAGMGGIWLPPNEEGSYWPPLLWRQPFTVEVQRQVVGVNCPRGQITNSDLELAATVAQQAVLANCYPVEKTTTHTFCDNTPAVAWQQKGSTTSKGAAAYLLRVAALHQRHHKYLSKVEYLPGRSNVMADDASRRWDLTDQNLLTHFNSLYPQKLPWRLSHLPPRMNSALTSSLFRKRLQPAWYLAAPDKPSGTGKYGATFVNQSASIPVSQPPVILSPISRYSREDTGMADLPPAVDRSDLERWRTPYVRWARRFPHWGPRIPGNRQPTRLTSDSTVNYGDTSAKIPHLLESDQFPGGPCKKPNESRRPRQERNEN